LLQFRDNLVFGIDNFACGNYRTQIYINILQKIPEGLKMFPEKRSNKKLFKSRVAILTVCFSIFCFATVITPHKAFATEWSVLDFGAVGDGVADDTVAIQATIAAASSGGKVYLPAGTYKTSNTLYMDYANVAVIGAGAGATSIVYDGFGSILMFRSVGPALTNSMVKGIRFSNIRAEVSGQGHSQGAIVTDNSYGPLSDITITENTIDGTPTTGLRLKGQRILVSNNIIRGTGYYGVVVLGEDIRIIGNKIYDINLTGVQYKKSPFFFLGGKNIVVSGNSISNMGTGLAAFSFPTTSSTGVLITDNTVTLSDTNQNGFEIYSGSFAAVGNTINVGPGYPNAKAIDAKGGSGAVFSDLILNGNFTTTPIVVRDPTSDIHFDNVVTTTGHSTGWQIDLKNSTRPVVQNSTLKGGFGVNLGGSTGARILNNEINVDNIKFMDWGASTNYTIVDHNDLGSQFFNDVTIGTSSSNSSIIMYDSAGSGWKCGPDNVGTFGCIAN
jgi:hypothetical protein